MKVAMVVYSFYEWDSRVRMYAEALAQHGHTVDVIALGREGQSTNDVISNVNLFRIQKRILNEQTRFDYLFRLLRFFVASFSFITKKSFGVPYDVIHVHSVPDFEVFATCIAKLKGSKIILDIHDIVPEFYASKFNVGNQSVIYKALIFFEKISASFADHVIAANHIWEKTLTSRSVPPEKCTTILNYPNPNIFHKFPRTRRDNKFIFLYPGTLNWHQGLDIAIEAFERIKDKIPEAEFHIYGEGPSIGALEQLVKGFGLEQRVFFKGVKNIEAIAEIMANADVGVVPKRNSSFGGEAFSTKILEFMTLGVPVIVSETKIDRYYFDDNIVKFFQSEDVSDLSSAMHLMATKKEFREQLASNASKFVENYTWGKKQYEYLSLVQSLLNKNTKVA